MNTIKSVVGCTLVLGAAVLVGQLQSAADAQQKGTRSGEPQTLPPTLEGGPAVGPDVMVVFLGEFSGGGGSDVHSYGQEASGTILAYSSATTSCNLGDQTLDWISGTNQHPVIGQGMYRLLDGRFENIGISWLKHGFCAVSEPGCTVCQATPCSNLGIGCADTYWATLNGTGLGPRYEVNPTTGFFIAAHSNPIGPSPVAGRLQVMVADMIPTSDPSGPRYFIEGQYITPDDAAAGNDLNNASWIEVSVANNSSRSLARISSTNTQKFALAAWQTADPSITLNTVEVDGQLAVAGKVTDNGDGTWHYEYAAHNLNSDQAVQTFSIPLPDCATVTNVGFHDVFYHSGELQDGTDWVNTHTGGVISWTTTDFLTNPNANALRWGTAYNFRFDADIPPQATQGFIDLGMFKPGATMLAQVKGLIPDVSACPPAVCLGDITPPGGNGAVNIDDLVTLLGAFGPCVGCPADITPPGGNGVVNIDDLVSLLGAFGACP